MAEAHVAAAQGLGWLGAGLWPVVHLRSFAKVTGPKPEGWLVKTIGGLIALVGATLLVAGRRDRVTPEIRGLAIGSALILGGSDVFYTAKRRISPVYLLDAVMQAGFLAAWLATPGRRSLNPVPTREPLG